MSDERIDLFREIMASYVIYNASLLFDDKCLTIKSSVAQKKEEMSSGYTPTKERFGADMVIVYDFKLAFDIVPRLKTEMETILKENGYYLGKYDNDYCYIHKR